MGSPALFLYSFLGLLCHCQFRAGADVGIIFYRHSLSMLTCTHEFVWSPACRLTASTQMLLGSLFIMVLICRKPSTVFVFLSLCFLCHPQFRAGGDVGIILYRRSLSVRTCTQEFVWSQMYRLTASTQKHRSIHAYTDTDRQTHTHTHTHAHM